MNKPKLSVILGSGFSKDSGLPTTTDIPDRFLVTPSETVLTNELEEEISKILRKFWERVFGYADGATPPSLEDHFTLLDLAANSGHHLGKEYSPKRLRAIRRMSIHRVFTLVTVGRKRKKHIREMLYSLNKNFALSIVTLNWDIVVERHLEKYSDLPKIPFYYPVKAYALSGRLAGSLWPHAGIPLVKVHGSTNWVYCDSCKSIYSGRVRSTALNRKTFLEPDDFKLFGCGDNVLSQLRSEVEDRDCPHCGNQLAGRVATFSYRKAFSIPQFQTIWERAHANLREAEKWLIVGYSLPEADFEFLHLLKSAQLARKKPDQLRIEVVIRGSEETIKRYKQFFGLDNQQIKSGGVKKWTEKRLKKFIKEH